MCKHQSLHSIQPQVHDSLSCRLQSTEHRLIIKRKMLVSRSESNPAQWREYLSIRLLMIIILAPTPSASTVSLCYRVYIQILPNISCSKLTQNNALTLPPSVKFLHSDHLYHFKLHTYYKCTMYRFYHNFFIEQCAINQNILP